MPKSVDVEDFAAKLALLAKRLNWSRAKLAQEVGIDKSIAARWLNGVSRPTGNSMMQLTAAVVRSVEGFTAADWDLGAAQFARRLGIAPAAAPAPSARPVAGRMTLSGLRNPPPAATWGPAYAGLWAGFYQSLTNRGIVRVCASEFVLADDGLRYAFTDGFFLVEGAAIATHTHVQAICEVSTLDNHLILCTFNSAQDLQGAAVIDGLVSLFGADHTPTAGPILLFRIDEQKDYTVTLPGLMSRVNEANDKIEREVALTGDIFGATQHIASPEILRSLCPVIGTQRADGQTDHLMRVPAKYSLATGKRAMDSLPAGAPLKMVPANLRRVLGLDPADKIRLVHSSKS